MVTFQIASDLHIEYKNNDVPNPLDYITPSSDNLILAGDIGSFYKINQLKEFLIKLCKNFKMVFYIPGNQEYYTFNEFKPMSMNTLINRLYEIEESIENLYILNQSSIILNDICITGCTLWSKPEIKIPKFIVRIHGINNIIYEKKHSKDIEYINKMIDYSQKNDLKLLMITHYCPSLKVLEGSRKRDKFSSLYATDLDYLLDKNKVHTWVCGHIHKNFDYISENGTRIVGNQKGKLKDKITDYYKDFVIQI
jgi:UDP-2,3-diacylglucosamine pyrophosphatase LpxH